jgi:hypothetical protein
MEVCDHDLCCKQGCSCMPPPNNLDYSFEPALDLSDWPVVAPKTLVHLLKDLDIANEHQNKIFSLLPKRKGEWLVVAPGKRSLEGCGEARTQEAANTAIGLTSSADRRTATRR